MDSFRSVENPSASGGRVVCRGSCGLWYSSFESGSSRCYMHPFRKMFMCQRGLRTSLGLSVDFLKHGRFQGFCDEVSPESFSACFRCEPHCCDRGEPHSKCVKRNLKLVQIAKNAIFGSLSTHVSTSLKQYFHGVV